MDLLKLARFRAIGFIQPRGPTRFLDMVLYKAMSGEKSGGSNLPTADNLTGVWVLNDVLTFPVVVTQRNILVTSNSEQITAIEVTTNSLSYYRTPGGWITANGRSTWGNEAYKIIDFGITGQAVSDNFYAWLTANAVYQG